MRLTVRNGNKEFETNQVRLGIEAEIMDKTYRITDNNSSRGRLEHWEGSKTNLTFMSNQGSRTQLQEQESPRVILSKIKNGQADIEVAIKTKTKQ